MRQEVTKYAFPVITRQVENPGPCTQTCVHVPSLFDTRPSCLASKREKLEAVNSLSVVDLLDF